MDFYIFIRLLPKRLLQRILAHTTCKFSSLELPEQCLPVSIFLLEREVAHRPLVHVVYTSAYFEGSFDTLKSRFPAVSWLSL